MTASPRQPTSEASLPLDQILLGDCVALMNALPEKCVDLVFADPPYNLQLQRELRRPDMTLVDAACDHWDRFGSFEEYDAFTHTWLQAARRVMKDAATLWVIGTYHNIYRVGAILMDLGFWILNDIAWIKTNPTPHMKGVRFCNAHETLIWAAKSQTSRRYTFPYQFLKAGNEDKQMRSDWYIPVCSGRERVEVDGRKAHTTQKPQALLHRVLVASSQPGAVVLDPFCGVGTTAAVAKRLDRRFITMDRDEGYVAAARRRVAAVTPALLHADAPLFGAPKPRIPFVTLVEQGIMPPGTVLTLRGQRSTAIVNSDGTVTSNGVRGSIHRMAARLLAVPACNGWESWLHEDPETGEQRPIDHLRPPVTPQA